MADHVIEFFSSGFKPDGSGGFIGEAFLLSGTWRAFPNPAQLANRKAILARSGIPTADAGRVDDVAGAYGFELIGAADVRSLPGKAVAGLLPAIQAVPGQVKIPAPAAAQAPVRPLQLVKVTGDPTGAVYAVGPGIFHHVTDGPTLNAGTAAGLWGSWGDVKAITAAQRDELVAQAAVPNGTYVPAPAPVADPAPAAPAVTA